MSIGGTNATIIVGGTPPSPTGDYLVRYFDVDGTILKEEWVNSGQNATPPSNPAYDNTKLTFNSWNQGSTNITSDKDIGAIYDTVDNKTYAKIRLTTVSGISPTLYLWKSDDSTLTIDWGDSNQSTFTNTGYFNTGSHTYSATGDYWITIWISSGTGNYRLGSGTTTTTFIGGSTQVYRNTLLSIYIDNNNLSVFNNAFYTYYSLSTISIPSSVTSIGTSTFSNCYSLTNISIPSSVTSIGGSAFQSCCSLATILIPSSVTSIGGSAFQSCCSLATILIPSSVTSIGTSTFSNCYSLTNISIPSSVTSIGDSLFQSCYSLTNISIPSSVTSIGISTFSNCFSILKYKCYRTTPPTLSSTNVFAAINSVCKIYVPDASLTAYKTATNWATYANYIYPLSDIGE